MAKGSNVNKNVNSNQDDDTKKKIIAIIIAIIIIIILLLSLLSCQDSGVKKLKGDSNIEEKSKDKDKKKNVDNDAKDEENSSNDVVVTNDNTGKVVTPVQNGKKTTVDTSKDNSKLDAARKAVEKAESTIALDDIINAQELVNDLDDGKDKEELEDRLEDVIDAYNARELVEKLEQMIKEADNKDNLDDSRDQIEDAIDFREESDVVDKVNDLKDSELKDDLLDRLDEISRVLDDKTAPVVKYLDDGEEKTFDGNVFGKAFFEKNGSLTIIITEDNLKESRLSSVNSEGNEKKVSYSKEQKEIVIDGTEDNNGDYTLYVIDDAYNYSQNLFTIDVTSPVVNGIEEKTYNKEEIESGVIPTSEEGTTATLDGKEFELGTAIDVEDGDHTLVVTDEAGNETVVNFSVDKTVPTVTNDFRIPSTPNRFLTIVILTLSEDITEAPEGWTLLGNRTIMKTFLSNSTEEIEFTDKNGNKGSYTVVVNNIDRTAPKVISEIKNPNGPTNKNVTVTLKMSEKVTSADNGWKVSSDGMTLTKVFTNNTNTPDKVTFRDEAGNTSNYSVSVTNIDRTAPKVISDSKDPEEPTSLVTTVVLTFDEAITREPIGWRFASNDKKSIKKVYLNNASEEIRFKDEAGNQGNYTVVVDNIDRTSPKVINVIKDPSEMTNGNVLVKLEMSEKIKNVSDGWTISEDGMTLTREFTDNIGLVVVAFRDMAGNYGFHNISINNIDRIAPSISLDAIDTEVEYGSEYTVPTATATDDDKEITVTPTITLNGEKVEDVDTTVPGEYVLTYNYTDEAGNPADTVSITVTVKEKEIIYASDFTVTGLNGNNLEMIVGETKKLDITITPEDADNKDLSFSGYDSTIISVDSEGNVSALSKGSTDLTISVLGAEGPITKTINVVVSEPTIYASDFTVTGLNGNNLEMIVGETKKLDITITPEDANNKDLSYSGYDSTIISVDSEGNVSALSKGSTDLTISVLGAEGPIAKTINVVVSDIVVEDVKVSQINVSLTREVYNVGVTGTATAIVMPENATNKNVTWSSSNTSVATVDNNGKVTAVGLGKATITATAKDGSGVKGSKSIEVIADAKFNSDAKINVYIVKEAIDESTHSVIYDFKVQEVNKITNDGKAFVTIASDDFSDTKELNMNTVSHRVSQVGAIRNKVFTVTISIENAGGKKVIAQRDLYVTASYFYTLAGSSVGLNTENIYNLVGNGYYFNIPSYTIGLAW